MSRLPLAPTLQNKGSELIAIEGVRGVEELSEVVVEHLVDSCPAVPLTKRLVRL